MSVKVAGVWELNWNTPLMESHLWDFPLRDFGVPEFHMTPVSGIKLNQSNTIDLIEHHTVEEMVNSFSDEYERVFVDEKGETLLHEFDHPEKCVYIFGRAGISPLSQKRPQDHSIRMLTKHNRGVLWPHQCLVTVLHDRLIKNVN